MTLVLLFGLLEIFPGLLLVRDKSQKQIESSDWGCEYDYINIEYCYMYLFDSILLYM